MTIDTLKILISDDSVLSRRNLKDHLISIGCKNIIEVSNGQAAIDSYKEHHPDLVFLDIVMPIKDGITALTEIREYDKHARVIMASSVGTQKHLKEAIQAGATDFIQKPLDSSQVDKVVYAVLEGGH